ncbi:hypothetical protein [Paraburkholderia sp. ZP32-5]|uniref:hypothetical protein n=1 Tax=Paraburkholderia sp. ZP32-5 TaxID=2883245 RepID=UPI001F39005D|nr:hypothetical protein [Paraburkholderia sp. ZP32-5]
MAKTNANPRQDWVSGLKTGFWSAKISISFQYGPRTAQFFETLILLGFALRYHSKRREGRGSTAAVQRIVRCDRSPGSGPQLLDGAVRVRIIGAFALFVST